MAKCEEIPDFCSGELQLRCADRNLGVAPEFPIMIVSLAPFMWMDGHQVVEKQAFPL